MVRPHDEWQNTFTYEGWILDVGDPTEHKGLLAYKVTVGFSDDEQIRVLAFRRAPSKRLVRGQACRVVGQFRFIPDEEGRVIRKLDALRVEVIDPPGSATAPEA